MATQKKSAPAKKAAPRKAAPRKAAARPKAAAAPAADTERPVTIDDERKIGRQDRKVTGEGVTPAPVGRSLTPNARQGARERDYASRGLTF